MFRKMGQILVELNCLSQKQVEQILQRQEINKQHFGKIAKDMFGVEQANLWHAWARQIVHILPQVDWDNAIFDDQALEAMSAAEAWQYMCLPLRYKKDNLICVTTEQHLPQLMAWLNERVNGQVEFMLAQEHELQHHMMQHYGQWHRQQDRQVSQTV